MPRFVSLLIAVSLLGWGTLQADILDSENFESYDAGFEIIDADDWEVAVDFEFTAAVLDSGLSYNQGAVSVDGGNRSLMIGPDMPSATTNNFVDWIFEEVAADGLGEVWFSYLIQTSETASTAIPDVDEDRDFFQMHFSADGDQAQSVSVVLDNTSPAVPGLGADHIYRARSGSSGNVTDPGQNYRNTPEETHLVVGKIEAVNGEYETISIFLNPGSPLQPAVPTAMATFAGVNATTLAQFTVRISALEAEDAYTIDEIKIGESFADVVPVDPNFLLGDFDGDASIGFGDFLLLAGNLFDGSSYNQGDIDFSGQVDLLDFIQFRDVYHAANAPGAAAVPEPSGLLLGAMTVAGLFVVRRRRRV